MISSFGASANVVVGGIVFQECSCVHVSVHACVCEYPTNIFSTISLVFVDGI